jgi:DnaJ-class molecular chaperone
LRHINRNNFFGNFGGGQQNVENSKLYDVLGVKKTDDATTIKRAYRKKVKENHPDRGGDTEKFKEINAAYEVLGDEKRRKMYDQHGLEGMKNEMGGMGGMGGMEDIFDAFFKGGTGQSSAYREQPKMRPLMKEMRVSLEELYNGAAKALNFQRDEKCKPCDGKGGKQVDTCIPCKGTGMVTKMVNLGPGMYSQSQSPCGSCGGQGETIKKENLCQACMGAKCKTHTAKIEVQVPKGAPNGLYINYPDQGNQHPVYKTGDLVVKLVPTAHPLYKKKKSDLYMQQKISLYESLTGFKFNIEKLDGTLVTIKTEPNEIIKHKQLKKVSGLGLPLFDRNYTFGDLYIEFIVEYPERVDDEVKEQLKEILETKTIDYKETNKSYQMKTIKQPEMEIIDEEERQESYDQDGSQQVNCNSQ